ncbi:hypothetical protein M5C95_14690 [Acidovorax sp. NCPPB 4044]|nr:hypothetical protein [Acidovorax sp. NCPPB 4044]
MKTVRNPVLSAVLPEIRSGSDRALLEGLIALLNHWSSVAERSARYPVLVSDHLSLDGSKAGLFAAAVDLRDLLAKSPQGREALRDFGFQPILEHVEGE